MNEPTPMPTYWALAEEVTHLHGQLDKFQAEDAKLQELCADMFDGMCDHDHCYTCHHWQEGYNGCEYHERMAQLGIEVD